MGTPQSAPQPYEAPAIEIIVRPAEIEREVQYAGIIISPAD